MNQLEPTLGRRSPALVKPEAAAWGKLRRYFEQVSHHHHVFDSFETSSGELEEQVRTVEVLLLNKHRATWLTWIADGPNSEEYVEVLRSRGDPEPTFDELTYRADVWRWQRIAFAPEEVLMRTHAGCGKAWRSGLTHQIRSRSPYTHR
jgi:hypothetical protein